MSHTKHEAPISKFRRKGLVYCSCLSCCVHNLQCGAAAELLLNLCDDTHTGALVDFKRDAHELAVNLAQGLTFSGNEVTDVLDCPEGVVELNTGIRTEFFLILQRGSTDEDVGGEVLSFELGGLGSLRLLHVHNTVSLTHTGGDHEEHEDHEHDIREGCCVDTGCSLVSFSNEFCHCIFLLIV